jgi:hypothetical protein
MHDRGAPGDPPGAQGPVLAVLGAELGVPGAGGGRLVLGPVTLVLGPSPGRAPAREYYPRIFDPTEGIPQGGLTPPSS